MISKAQLKYVQSLHLKKYRQRHGVFLVEGGKSVIEALSSGLNTEHVFLTPEFAAALPPHLLAGRAHTLASAEELTRLGTLAHNDTALALAARPPEVPLPAALPQSALLLALDDVRDPGNLGTLLRLADWYGLPGVVLSATCADPYAPKTVAASMGSFARVRVWERDLGPWLASLPPGTGIFGADLVGENVHRAALRPAGVLVMGSESHAPDPGRGRLPEPAAAHSEGAGRRGRKPERGHFGGYPAG